MSYRRRLVTLAAVVFLLWASLIARLIDVQLVNDDTYRRRAADTRRRMEPVRAPRGRILDRKGRVLAADVPVYRVAIELEDLDPGTTLPVRVASALRLPGATLEVTWRALEMQAEHGPIDGAPLVLATSTTARQQRAFAKIVADFDGLSIDGQRLLASRALLTQRWRTVSHLARLVGLDEARLRAKIESETRRAMAIEDVLNRRERLRTPIVVAGPVAFDTVAWLEEESEKYPGVSTEVGLERTYPYGSIAGQVVGHMGPIAEKEVGELRQRGRLLDWRFWREATLESFLDARDGAHFPDDRVGREGVEASYDEVLAGKPGARIVERDRRTREYHVVDEVPSEPGRDVTLSIDLDLQADAEAALDAAVQAANGGQSGGAFVMIDVKTGDVLVEASAPRYDPGALGRDYAALAAARPSPLIDRAIAALLPPGSTVKPLFAAAALEEGIALDGVTISPLTTIVCKGYLHDPHAKTFRCDARYGHGPISLEGALAQSCNIYFFLCGEQLGEAGLTRWGERFGLGERTGIDLPGEAEGLFPSAAWKRKRFERASARVLGGRAALERSGADLASALLFGSPLAPLVAAEAEVEIDARAERLRAAKDYRHEAALDAGWGKGDSRNTAIGQGNVLATPLQIANAAATLARGGRRMKPHVAIDASVRESMRGADVPTDDARLPIKPSTLAAVTAGMRAVVEARHGTAHDAGLATYHVAGKTGTAQAGTAGDQAWFMGFAPAEAPEVAFACAIEHVQTGLAGGSAAAPVVEKVLGARASIARKAVVQATPGPAMPLATAPIPGGGP